MITKIGLIAGDILNLLEDKKRPINFIELQFSLNENDHLIWMALGCLIGDRYVNALEKCVTVTCKAKNIGRQFERKSLEFDKNEENLLAEVLGKEPVTLARHLICVAGEILSLLETCQAVMSLETIEVYLNEPKEDILMALGWLIRQGYVCQVAPGEMIFSRLPKALDINSESLCHMQQGVLNYN